MSASHAPTPHATRELLLAHAQTVAEQADRHAMTMESILAVLRSTRLTDQAARATAIELAAASLVEIRMATDAQRESMLEPVAGAFSRLRLDLRPLVRFGDLDIQFIEPPATGRALPGEVAHAARSIVRSAVLALVDSAESRRVRVQWDCDGLNLLIGIRDDGRGELTVHDDSLRPIAERVSALDGELRVTSTRGWGSEVSVSLPLDPPTDVEHPLTDVALSPREREVFHLLATGAANKDIAAELGISENTVKFHMSNLLRKAGARSRAALVAQTR